MNDFARMFAAMADEDDDRPDIADCGKVELLQDLFKRYSLTLNNGCRFSPGDLVTPRRNSNVKGAGEPHIVLEVRNRPEPTFVGDNAVSSAFGVRQDIRVSCYNKGSGSLALYWAESFEFEPWSERS